MGNWIRDMVVVIVTLIWAANMITSFVLFFTGSEKQFTPNPLVHAAFLAVMTILAASYRDEPRRGKHEKTAGAEQEPDPTPPGRQRMEFVHA